MNNLQKGARTQAFFAVPRNGFFLLISPPCRRIYPLRAFLFIYRIFACDIYGKSAFEWTFSGILYAIQSQPFTYSICPARILAPRGHKSSLSRRLFPIFEHSRFLLERLRNLLCLYRSIQTLLQPIRPRPPKLRKTLQLAYKKS